jgi:hypothetical protein
LNGKRLWFGGNAEAVFGTVIRIGLHAIQMPEHEGTEARISLGSEMREGDSDGNGNRWKKAGPEGPLPDRLESLPRPDDRQSDSDDQARGEVVLPLGDTTGGHGLPGVGLMPGLFGDVPLLLPWVLPVPGFDGLELDDPALGVAGAVEPDVPSAVPGKVPQGEPLGLLGVLGFIVDGCEVGVLGEGEPGAVAFGDPLGTVVVFGFCGEACGVAVPAGGVAVLAGGVAVLAGGVAGLAGGVAGEPGLDPGLEV